MLIVLPPSEGKSLPLSGPVLELSSLSFALELTKPRSAIKKKLVTLAKGRKGPALEALGLTPRQVDQLELDASLNVAFTAPAIEIYSGVLYEALDWNSLPASIRKRSNSQLLIISALFGALRPFDLIPAYRLSMESKLPKIGGLGPYWKKHLPQALNGIDEELIIDLRSQTYVKAWRTDPAITASVRIFVERANKRSVVSHMAKKARGEVARTLLSLTKTPTRVDEAAHVLSKTFEIELVKPTSANTPYSMDVILH
ncbi:MAG TPA: peroxide stress protein YaaA [Candidatus Nanopelagicaceae bacterium]|nr:peroxide stress protein YaaA [Candidatus Nanopelagicaceae bacterium]